MSFMYERGRGSIYDNYPSSKPKSKPTEVPKEDEEKGFFESIGDFFSSFGGDDSPAPVSGGRGNVVESRNERSDYINDVVVPSPVSAPERPQIYEDVLGPDSDDNAYTTRYNPQTEIFEVVDNPAFMRNRNKDDITRNLVQYIPPNMRDALMVGGQYGRSIPHALVDNIVGLNDNVQSVGEDLGAYAVDDPLGFGTDIVTGLAEGAYNLVTSPIDTVSGYLGDVYGAATRDQTNRTADQRLGDLFTAGSIIPVAKVGQGLGSAAKNSSIAKGFRGELAADFYGPDGPQVAPNVGGFRVPETDQLRESLTAEYDILKSSGLSDYEIESEYGIKAYQTNDPSVPRIVGTVQPSSEVDVSSEPYTLEKMSGSYGGVYQPSTDEIIINQKNNPTPARIDQILRHEVEHRRQREAGKRGYQFGTGGMEYSFRLQEKALEDLNSQIRQERDPSKKAELLAERDRVANIDAAGSYFNSPTERGARQAETGPFTTYDPTVTAAELLDPQINPNRNLLGRIDDSINRAILPTYGGLSRFREMGPRVPFSNDKLFKGLAEAALPLARMNIPRTPSTRGNQPVPFIAGPDGRVDEAVYSLPEGRSIPDDIQKMIDGLNKKAPVVEYENRKAQMMANGISGTKLQSNLDNLARNLGIERTDR